MVLDEVFEPIARLRSSQGTIDLLANIKRSREVLKSVLRRSYIPPSDAEDLLQQAFLSFIQHQSKIHLPEAWLVGTLRKHCLLYWRERRRRLYNAVDGSLLEWFASPVEASQEGVALREDVSRAIARIHPRCRSLLTLRYRLGLESSELARERGYSQTSISKITLRCLAAVTRQLIHAEPLGCSCLSAWMPSLAEEMRLVKVWMANELLGEARL